MILEQSTITSALPFKVPLWAHQRDILEKAKDRTHYALFAEMGTGKTATTINILRQLYYKYKKLLPTLILCPPVVRENWKREFELHSTVSDRVVVLSGSQKERIKLMEEKVCPDAFGAIPQNVVVVTNYEALLMKDLYALIKKWGPKILVCDESHKLKNYKSKRTKICTELADLSQFRFILSGTPILNSPMDIYAQFRILDKGETFGKNFFGFRNTYFFDKNAGMPAQRYFPNWQPRMGSTEEFNKKIYAKAARVLKKDCLDLPPLVRKKIGVELTPKQEKAYLEMKNHLIAFLEKEKVAIAEIALTKALRLQQIVTGFIVDDEERVVELDASPRKEALSDILEEVSGEHKVLIWACFKHNYEAIKEVVEKHKLSYSMLIGGMTDRQRQEGIDSFQNDPKVRVMIANQQAGGVGVNLTAASYAVYYSRNFSLEADVQSESRCHRGGSERHTSVTRIDLVSTGTIDEAVLEALARKENIANKILRQEFLRSI